MITDKFICSIMQVQLRRSVKDRDAAISSENGSSPHVKTLKPPVVRKGKLVVVDLAGSERIDKSGAYLGYLIYEISFFLFNPIPVHNSGCLSNLQSIHFVSIYV